MIYGNSTQETRSGKNLFNPELLVKYGATVAADGSYYFASGINKGEVIWENTENYSGTYAISSKIKYNSDSARGVFFDINYTDGTNDQYWAKHFPTEYTDSTFTTSTGKTVKNITLNYGTKSTSVNMLNIQLEKGSSATSYEKYGATPSPEFPSEIKSVGDLLTSSNCSSYGSDACNNVGKYVIQVKNRGKNLLDVDNFISTFNQYKDAGLETTKTTFDGYDCMKVYGKLSIEGRNVQYLKNQFKDNTQYTFSLDIYDVSGGVNNNLGMSSIIEYTDGTSDFFVSGPRNFGEWKTITLTSKSNKTVSYIRFGYGTGYAYSYIKNWQIEEGSSATEYESYKEAITNIYLDEPLRKVGDYADYIDFANNKVIRYIKNIDLSKYAMGLYNYNSLNGIYIINALDETKSRAVGLSNRENKIGKYYDSTGHYMWIGVANTNVYWVGILDHLGISTVAEFRQYLNSNPANIDYVLDTPTEETIDLPDIKILEGSSTLSINTSVSPSNVKLTTNK